MGSAERAAAERKEGKLQE
jgi:hypothetical protein